MTSSTIGKNLEQVLERIGRAAQRAGRDPDAVRLVVVTKGHPVETVREVVGAGARRLGENYAEEGLKKREELGQVPGLEWHMIGHVQSRKARYVCEGYDWMHSLDSLKLARRLENSASELERTLPVLLECNVSGEETKGGWPAWQPERWVELVPEIESVLALPHLSVHGLMTMAPFLEDPQAARPYFQLLRTLQNFLEDRFPNADWGELSMGMSADYEVAVQEGATLVRVGTAILGPRSDKN